MRTQNAQGMEVVNQIQAPSGMGAAPDDSLYVAKADAANGKVELQSAYHDADTNEWKGCGSSIFADDVFELKKDALCTLLWAADGKTVAVPFSEPSPIAIFDGSRNGKVYTGHLLNPATGAAGNTAVQWMFWGDAGEETLIDENQPVVLTHKCPAYLENDEDWSPSVGPKYMAVLSSQPSKTLFAKFTGSRNGKRYTGRLVNDDGSLGANIQWIFDGGNDPGTADVIDAGAYVKVRKAPAWLASNPAYGAVGTYGEKYEADSPIWAVLA